ncbi:MAG: amino acid permease [Streptosporangiaceae bacterium]
MADIEGQAPGRAPVGDEDVLSTFGYGQELRRRLRFFSIFAVAFSIISISTGIFLNYGFGLAYWGPAMIWLWPVALVGQLLVALVVAELGTRIPLAGYAYQWSARLVNPSYGWFVGFAGLMYMTVGGGAIILLAATPLLLSEFGLAATPHLTLAVAIIIMILPVVINVISVQVAARVNNIAVFTEILGTVVFGVLLLVMWGLHSKPTHTGASILFNTTSVVHSSTWYAIALAGLVGVYTLVGFELAADLSEEAVSAGATVPRAVIWAVTGSGVLGMIALVGFTLAIPNLKTVEGSGLPLLTIGSYWLGSGLTKVFIAFVVFSMFAITVVGAAAQARLVYSLARDNMLPWSRFFRKVNSRTQTPVAALVVFGVINIGFMIYGYLQTNSFGTLVAATAIIPYIIYFLITVAYAVKRRQTAQVVGSFSLGRWARPVIALVLGWTVLIMLALALPTPFHGSDWVIAGGAVLAALWYFLALRRRLRAGTAGPTSIEQVAAAQAPAVRQAGTAVHPDA